MGFHYFFATSQIVLDVRETNSLKITSEDLTTDLD